MESPPNNRTSTACFRFNFGPFVLDTSTREFFVKDHRVELIGLRWKLLCLLLEKHPRATHESEVYNCLWPKESGDNYGKLKNLLFQIRKQIAEYGEEIAIDWRDDHLKIIDDVEKADIYSQPVEALPERPRHKYQVVDALLSEIRNWIRAFTCLLFRPKKFFSETFSEASPNNARHFRFIAYFVVVTFVALVAGGYTVDARTVAIPILTLVVSSIIWLLVYRGQLPAGILMPVGAYFASGLLSISYIAGTVASLAFYVWEPDCRADDRYCNIIDLAKHQIHDTVFALSSTSWPRFDADEISPALYPLAAIFGCAIVMGAIWMAFYASASQSVLRINKTKVWLAACLSLFIGWFGIPALFNLPAIGALDTSLPVCEDPPVVPTLNVWPTIYRLTGPGCRDLPLIEGRDPESPDERSRRTSENQREHDSGIVSLPGHQIRVRVYFNNGAANSVRDAVAKNVHVRINLQQAAKTRIIIKGELWADNAPKVLSSDFGKGGDLNVNLTAPGKLVFVPGSAYICVSLQRAKLLNNVDFTQPCPGDPSLRRTSISDNITVDGANIGNLRPMWEDSGIVVGVFDVVAF